MNPSVRNEWRHYETQCDGALDRKPQSWDYTRSIQGARQSGAGNGLDQ